MISESDEDDPRELATVKNMLRWRLKTYPPGCILVDYGIGAGWAHMADLMEGWGAALTVSFDHDGKGLALDTIALPRVDVLLLFGPSSILAHVCETVRRTKPYMLINLSPPDDAALFKFLEAAGYRQVAKEGGSYLALPPGDPNWVKIKTHAAADAK